MIKGFDVSHWQGKEDWPALKAAHGIVFGFVKATESNNFTDSTLAVHWPAIKAAGLVRGAYHFARPSESSAAVQADYFVNAVNAAGGFSGSDLPIMDFETSGGLGTNAGLDWYIVWADRVQSRTGKVPFIYFGSWAADDARTSDLRDHYCGWWYPRYPSAWADRAAWPAGYDDLVLPSPNRWGRAPDMWQFSSSFPAGGEAHDANVSPLTLAQLQTLNTRTANGDDMPLTTEEIDAIARRTVYLIMHEQILKTTAPEVAAGGGTLAVGTALENIRRWAHLGTTRGDENKVMLTSLMGQGPPDVDEAAIVAGLAPLLASLNELGPETLQSIGDAVANALSARLDS